MKFFVKKNKTIVENNTWIPPGVKALLLDDSGSSVTLAISDIEKPIKISSFTFAKEFEEISNITEEEKNQIDSGKRLPKLRPLKNAVNNSYPAHLADLINLGIDKSYQDAFKTPGNTKVLTIKEFHAYMSGSSLGGSLTKVGDPVFNRRSRWSVVADVANWKNLGEPAPIGIRPEDYAPISDCIKIFWELVQQVLSMQGLPEPPQEVLEKFPLAPEPAPHQCSYCGQLISIELFAEQQYSAKEHALNFCHRDPSEKLGRTRPGNIYFGHTSCNRIQGGLSELDRVKDGLRLLSLHRNYMEDEVVKNLLKTLG